MAEHDAAGDLRNAEHYYLSYYLPALENAADVVVVAAERDAAPDYGVTAECDAAAAEDAHHQRYSHYAAAVNYSMVEQPVACPYPY